MDVHQILTLVALYVGHDPTLQWTIKSRTSSSLKYPGDGELQQEHNCNRPETCASIRWQIYRQQVRKYLKIYVIPLKEAVYTTCIRKHYLNIREIIRNCIMHRQCTSKYNLRNIKWQAGLFSSTSPSVIEQSHLLPSAYIILARHFFYFYSNNGTNYTCYW